MPLLAVDDWPAVRAALDVKLNEVDLPNKVIEQDIYSGAAMREVIKRVPTAESMTGDDLKRVTTAAVLLTAARLVYAVQQITSLTVQAGDVNYSRQAWNPEKKVADLRGMAEDELAAVIEPSAATPGRPTIFARAKGRRGQ